MKKTLIFCFSLLLVLCSGCVNEEPSLEGYWLSPNNENLVFDSEGNVTSGNHSGKYTIYDTNKVQMTFSILFVDEILNAFFEIEDEVLTLTDLDNGSIYTYYGNAEKQQEIRNAINAKATEEEALAQAEQAIIDYNAMIDDLLKQIRSNKTKIHRLEEEKQNYQTEIARCEEGINDSRNKITILSSQIQSESDINEISYLTDDISFEEGYINYYLTEIEYYSNQILDCDNSIDACFQNISEIEQQLSQYEYNQDLTQYSQEVATAIQEIQERVLNKLDNTYKYRKLLYMDNGTDIINKKPCLLIQVCFDMGSHVATLNHFAYSPLDGSIYELNLSSGEYQLTTY